MLVAEVVRFSIRVRRRVLHRGTSLQNHARRRIQRVQQVCYDRWSLPGDFATTFYRTNFLVRPRVDEDRAAHDVRAGYAIVNSPGRSWRHVA